MATSFCHVPLQKPIASILLHPNLKGAISNFSHLIFHLEIMAGSSIGCDKLAEGTHKMI